MSAVLTHNEREAAVAEIARQFAAENRTDKVIVGQVRPYPSGRWRVPVAAEPRNGGFRGHQMVDLGGVRPDPDDLSPALMNAAFGIKIVDAADGITRERAEHLHRILVGRCKELFRRVWTPSTYRAFAARLAEVFPGDYARWIRREVEREARQRKTTPAGKAGAASKSSTQERMVLTK